MSFIPGKDNFQIQNSSNFDFDIDCTIDLGNLEKALSSIDTCLRRGSTVEVCGKLLQTESISHIRESSRFKTHARPKDPGFLAGLAAAKFLSVLGKERHFETTINEMLSNTKISPEETKTARPSIKLDTKGFSCKPKEGTEAITHSWDKETSEELESYEADLIEALSIIFTIIEDHRKVEQQPLIVRTEFAVAKIPQPSSKDEEAALSTKNQTFSAQVTTGEEHRLSVGELLLLKKGQDVQGEVEENSQQITEGNVLANNKKVELGSEIKEDKENITDPNAQ
jgi:hypothetical protein